jgi:hypothetical protein
MSDSPLKIALVGSAPSSVRLAPYNNPDWQIWGVSPGAWSVAPRSDVWFEIHRWEPGQPWFSQEYVNFLKNYPGTVWMSEYVPEVKNCKVLPVEYLVKKYSPYFFTSSLSWMFAMAMELNPKSIGLWGVDMAATEEYGYQRAGCQYFALLAKAMGIEVGVPPESDLFRPSPLYGVCETTHAWIKNTARTRELNERIRVASEKLSMASQEIQFLNGCKDDMNWQLNTWFGNVDYLGRNYIEPTEVPALKTMISPETPCVSDEDLSSNVKQLYVDVLG